MDRIEGKVGRTESSRIRGICNQEICVRRTNLFSVKGKNKSLIVRLIQVKRNKQTNKR